MSAMRKAILPLWEEEEEQQSEAALRDSLIDEYANLQRIKTAPDRDKEIEFQIRVVKAKLAQYGVTTDKLDLP